MADERYRVYKLKRVGGKPKGIHYDRALNDDQREAVFTLEGPLLVIAGAGTGKTRTLTYRVARLLETGLPPDEIVLLTFTRRAAQEMVGRVEKLLGVDCQGIVGGTYHAFAVRMLTRFPPEGYPNRFSILDRGDAEDTIQLVRGQRGLGRGERRFPRKRTLMDVFSKAVNRSTSIKQILEDEYEHFMPHLDAVMEIEKEYNAFKRRHALMDYDDLLVYLLEALREEGRACKEMRARFKYLLVDEYQDTNQLQAEITDRLVAEHRNLMVVGDDSQSIYAFRGADYRNIVEFPTRYEDATVVKLERNYRSTQPVLDVTNAIIAKASIGFEKRLYTERRGGEKPAIVMTDGEADQAAFIAQRIIEHREEGISLNRMAVLFRSSFQSYELEIELARRDIPYVKYGGFRFLEAAHIKDVMAHLRVLANPRDAISWNRLLCLVEGVGPKRAADVVAASATQSDPFAFSKAEIGSPLQRRLTALEELFGRLRTGKKPPAAMVDEIIRYYEPILKDRYDDQQRRGRDLEHFQVLSEGYDGLERLLSDMSLDPPSRAVENRLATPLDEGERLVLSTIHSAKGMEWKVVIVLGALDGFFPSFWSARDPEALEEERRLMYVATTRTRDQLYITYPVGIYHPSSGRVLSKPSRFIEDVPGKLVERWAVTG